MLRLREPPRALLQRQILAPAGAVAEELFIGRLPSEEPDNLPRAAAEQWFGTESGGAQPVGRLGTEREELGPHRLMHCRVLVREQADERGPLAFGQPGDGFCERERVHVLLSANIPQPFEMSNKKMPR